MPSISGLQRVRKVTDEKDEIPEVLAALEGLEIVRAPTPSYRYSTTRSIGRGAAYLA